MAVTITQQEVAVAIRAATSADDIPAPVAEVLKFLFPAASAIILTYAPGAPDSVHDASMIRLCGWLYEADPADPSAARPLQASGTAPLLAQWRVQRAGVISGTGEPLPPVIPPAPDAGSFILTSVNGEYEWIEFPVPS